MHEGDQRTQLLLRLHIFHLLQTVSFHTVDLDVGVPPPGWHGEAYRGHILWDECSFLKFRGFQVERECCEIFQRALNYRVT